MKGGILEMSEVEIGKVTDFFAKPVVAGIQLSSTLRIGDKIHVKGNSTDMELTVKSMQIERVSVTEGKPGDIVGVEVPDRVRRGDKVYRITEGP